MGFPLLSTSICVLLLSFSSGAFGQPPVNKPAALNELEYITENYPPFNYVEQGILKGEAVELLIAATALAGSPVNARDISLQPWARGFHNALEGPGRVLFSTTRTPERESLFKWAGPIGSNHIVLVGKKSRGIRLSELSDLNQYRIGAVRDDVGELFLRDLQLEKTIITLGVQPESIAKMLQSNRIDLWIYGESSAFNVLKHTGADLADYEVVKVLKSLDLYFAFSTDIDDALVKQLQNAIDTIKGAVPAESAPAEPTPEKTMAPSKSQLYQKPTEP